MRDEGTSYHYAAPSRFMEINKRARKAIEKTILEHGMKYQEVITWSTDGFFRETKEKVAYRKAEGCSVVEMECFSTYRLCSVQGCDLGNDIIYSGQSCRG